MNNGMNAQTGTQLSGREHLRQSIQDILSTPIGTRVMRRGYGSRLPDLMDEPTTPDLIVRVYAETAKALAKWEPRFRVNRIFVEEAGAGRLTIGLEGEELIGGERIKLEGMPI